MAMILGVIAGARLVAAPAAPSAPAAPATVSVPDALKQLEPGSWQIEVEGRPNRQLCLADPMALVQIEHDQTGCTRFVVANEPRSATVQYSCARAGWGRSTLRVSTPRQVSISTQGIARNAPFDYKVAAHRVGECSAAGTVSSR
jgi:hypothetical protein